LEIKNDPETGENNLTVKRSQVTKNLADFSVITFLKIIAGINKKAALLEYRKHEGLNRRMPNYAVKMGFGLHIGWAIEGAIGSGFKIDASYLSPNVNMASRLEAATKQFGVPLLLTDDLFSYLSKKGKSICRYIDRVTVKGSIEPIGLYTVDVEIEGL
jgi:class 3 adenylate cyclase